MMDMGNIMGGQNPYAGQDTGFGDSIRALLTKQFGGGQPTPTGNMGAVDPAQFGNENMAPDFNVPKTFVPGMYDNQRLGGMQGATPASSAGIPQPEGMPPMAGYGGAGTGFGGGQGRSSIPKFVQPTAPIPQGNFGSVDPVMTDPMAMSMMNSAALRNPNRGNSDPLLGQLGIVDNLWTKTRR